MVEKYGAPYWNPTLAFFARINVFKCTAKYRWACTLWYAHNYKSFYRNTIDYYFCPGESKTQICSTNHTFLKWSISTIRQHETRSIPYLDQNVFVPPLMMDSSNFTFSRESSPGALPLVSIMTIMNVNSNLEGTMISCTGLNSSSVTSVVLMTTIHVYDMDIGRSLICTLMNCMTSIWMA